MHEVESFAHVLGHNYFLCDRFYSGQNQGIVLRCHVLDFDATSDALQQIHYERMKTSVLGEDVDGGWHELVLYRRGRGRSDVTVRRR